MPTVKCFTCLLHILPHSEKLHRHLRGSKSKPKFNRTKYYIIYCRCRRCAVQHGDLGRATAPHASGAVSQHLSARALFEKIAASSLIAPQGCLHLGAIIHGRGAGDACNSSHELLAGFLYNSIVFLQTRNELKRFKV